MISKNKKMEVRKIRVPLLIVLVLCNLSLSVQQIEDREGLRGSDFVTYEEDNRAVGCGINI